MKRLILTTIPMCLSLFLLAQTESIQYLDSDSSIYVVKEFPASPIGGMTEFHKWNQENLKTSLKSNPDDQKKKVYVYIIIDVDGKLIEPKIAKGIDKLYDEEAIRLFVENPTQWNPAKQGRTAVKSKMAMYVEF